MPWARILPGPMPAQPALRRRLSIVALIVATSLSLPSAVAAVVAIPHDQTADVLQGATITAIVGDVDGDGIRELVRLRASASNQFVLDVEVVSVGSGGHIRIHAPASLVDASPQANDLVGRVDQPARLLAWRLHGIERVLVAAVGVLPDQHPCCLTVWQVELSRDDATLRPMPGLDGSAGQILAVDMDADGTDELVLESPETIAVFRWTGDGFALVRRLMWFDSAGTLISLGESDGRPGDEAGSVLSSETGAGSVLLARVALDAAGDLRLERADLPFFGELAPLAGPDGGRLVIGSDFEGAALLHWPAGAARITVEATAPRRRGIPLAALGAGADARLVLLRDGGTVDVLGPDLRPNLLGIAGGVAGASFERTPAAPYVGLLPGGLPDGEEALIFQGRMVTPASGVGGRSRLGERIIASLPGVTPIGVFGPGGARMGLAIPNSLLRSTPTFDADRKGGQLTIAAGSSAGLALAVADTDAVLSAEPDNGRLDPQTPGAVADERGSRRTMLTRGPFSALLAAPAGSRVLARAMDDAANLRVDESGSATVTLDPVSARAGGAFQGSVLVLTPSGHGYHAEWDVRIMAEPPKVEVDVPFAPLSFSVPLTGRTDPGAHVSVDGRAIAVRPDGSFSAQAVVGPVPRDVQVEATDAVGNVQRRSLSVVGFLDYRQLPWIPLVALLTVLAGVLLYVRAPRPAPPSARLAGDDARLEEIE
jgi:hypothetical protein